MSEEKAREQAIRFSDIREIIKVIDFVYSEGINVFMCTTQERVADICQHVKAHPDAYRDFCFYPCMPYAHKYANAVTEHGLIQALKQFLPADNKIGTLFKGGVSLARRDIDGIGRILIDSEMKMFSGLRTPVIFLQNVITDLLLGLGVWEAFSIFDEHVRSRFDAEPGFITMNLPRLLGALEHVGITNPIVCASINRMGFRMCGGKEVYEKTIAEGHFRAVAMSVFASGAIPYRDALEYIIRQKRIQSIVFGASSTENIRKTKLMIDELDEKLSRDGSLNIEPL